jgi:hypothetical protein
MCNIAQNGSQFHFPLRRFCICVLHFDGHVIVAVRYSVISLYLENLAVPTGKRLARFCRLIVLEHWKFIQTDLR